MPSQADPNGCILDAPYAFGEFMATLTIKNLPADLYARLKARAALEGRSLNRQAIVALEQSLALHSAADTEAFLAKVAAWRARNNVGPFSDDVINAAKREGRE